MFSFIKETDTFRNSTESRLSNYEAEWNITFPELLKTYYLYHNMSTVKKNKSNFPVSLILPIDDNDSWSVQEYKEAIEKDLYVFQVDTKRFIPFAVYDDFICYFWEVGTEKVYWYGSGEDSELAPAFDSIESFFENLNQGVAKAEKKFQLFRKRT